MKYRITKQLVPIRRTISECYEFNLVFMNITLNTAKEVESFIKNNASDVFFDFLIDREGKDKKIFGQPFTASLFMSKISPRAYNEAFKIYLNALDIASIIDKMSDGETILMLGFEIKAEK